MNRPPDWQTRLIRILVDSDLPTPLLVYAEEPLRAARQCLESSLALGRGGPVSVYFAVKSCYRLPVLRSLCQAALGAEVMSATELSLARAAGFSGERILANGLGRSASFTRQLTRERARLVLDSETDLASLCAALDPAAAPLRVGVRVAVDVSGFRDSPYAERTKLGLRPGSAQLARIVERCAAHPALSLDLLHAHVASNTRDPGIYLHAMDAVDAVRREVAQRWHVSIAAVSLGGGFSAIRFAEAAQPLPWLVQIGRGFAERFGDIELIVEPGRALVDASALVVATVTALKEDGERTYIVTDAGTNTLMPFKEAAYALIEPPSGPGGRFLVSVVDGITSTTSVVIRSTFVDELPAPGTRIVLANCGAYTSALSQFWAYDPMPVGFYDANQQLHMDLSADTLRTARRLLLGV